MKKRGRQIAPKRYWYNKPDSYNSSKHNKSNIIRIDHKLEIRN